MGEEIPDAAQICKFCEASVQPEPSEEEKQAVREMLEQMGPDAPFCGCWAEER